MANDRNPKIWRILLKLVVGAVVLWGLVWFALWYADKYGDTQLMNPPLKPSMDWGIVNDSPIRNNR